MSCIDLKTSPYACRDRFYLTLESSRDPPNHFKWLEAAQELKTKMNLTFDDPRFMFNFVMTRKYMHVIIILLLKKKTGINLRHLSQVTKPKICVKIFELPLEDLH